MTVWVVIGIMRSGTSFISSVLHKGGISMGIRFQDPHPTFQPNGFWEDLDFLEINERILSHFGARAGSGMLFNQKPKPDEIIQIASRYKNQMADLVNSRVDSYQNWGFKDPRLITTYPAWQLYLPKDTKILWVYRKPENVLVSLSKTTRFTKKYANQFLSLVKWYLDYLPRILPYPIMVDFDRIRQGDQYQLDKFQEATGISQDVVMECLA